MLHQTNVIVFSVYLPVLAYAYVGKPDAASRRQQHGQFAVSVLEGDHTIPPFTQGHRLEGCAFEARPRAPDFGVAIMECAVQPAGPDQVKLSGLDCRAAGGLILEPSEVLGRPQPESQGQHGLPGQRPPCRCHSLGALRHSTRQVLRGVEVYIAADRWDVMQLALAGDGAGNARLNLPRIGADQTESIGAAEAPPQVLCRPTQRSCGVAVRHGQGLKIQIALGSKAPWRGAQVIEVCMQAADRP